MEHIYHYTSIEAFDKMLINMKKEGTSNLMFWASNIHYMNDPHELEFIYDELIKVLPEIEREIGIKEFPISSFEEHDMLNWVKANRKVMNKGEMKEERKEAFQNLLELCEQYRRKNQYA